MGDQIDPALLVAGLDPGFIHFSDDGDPPGNAAGLALGPGHAAQARGDKEESGQVTVFRDTQLLPSRVEEGVVGAVDDTLGADVHPAAGRHLPIVGDAHGGGPVKVGQVVVLADHESVGQDDPGG